MSAEAPADGLQDFLLESGLAKPGDPQAWTPLSGGVSSDIWKVELPGRTICVKRALAKLRVQADWRAPPDRNLYEWRWFSTVSARLPGAAPEPLAFDPDRRLLAMAFLEPSRHPLWKAELLAGRVNPGFAADVGDRLGRIHALTAAEPSLAAAFDNDEGFFALRIDAYLLATAERRPEAGAAIRALAERTAGIHRAVVHGDVSPKNILAGPEGPVFLDAETAWWGDPAFDLAFCLNHLLLKRLVVAGRDQALRQSFTGLARAYLARVDWEPSAELEGRAASLLPALNLARVDGKSPVEYLTSEAQREAVRRAALPLLQAPPATLEQVLAAWDRTVST